MALLRKGDAAKHAVQTPPENIIKVTDIPYVDDGNIFHQLDVYYPDSAAYSSQIEELPVIIDIHGGGWMYGDKDLNEYYCLELANRGFIVFNISYRLVPDVTVNEQLQDCALALQWISQHIAEYPANPNNIMLTGDSAGGMLAVYSATLLQSPELRDTFEVVDGGLDIAALTLTSPVAFMKDGGAFSVYTKVMWAIIRTRQPVIIWTLIKSFPLQTCLLHILSRATAIALHASRPTAHTIC